VGQGLVDWGINGIDAFFNAFAVPLLTLTRPVFLITFFFYLPFVVLSYLLRGFVFRTADAGASAFFVPYSSRGVWEPGQIVLVVFGIGCLVYHCVLFRRSMWVSLWGPGEGAEKGDSINQDRKDLVNHIE
jgi:hypothetical protein